ncbi:unnamed protein product [Sphagnum jensenii]|uniref:Uncharacterized protein n=1 Tax=Sphagnum jensenii TaxID=128206 RepID=A0ABP1BBS3_9BRYO
MSAVAVPQQQFAQQQQGREVIAEQHLGAEGCWYVASNWSNDWFINAVQVVIPLAGCHGYGNVMSHGKPHCYHCEGSQSLQDCVIPLPKPLTVTEADKAEGQVLENGKKSHEDLHSPESIVSARRSKAGAGYAGHGGAYATGCQIQAITSNAFAQ